MKMYVYFVHFYVATKVESDGIELGFVLVFGCDCLTQEEYIRLWHNFRTVFHILPRTQKLTQTENRQSTILFICILRTHIFFSLAMLLHCGRCAGALQAMFSILWILLDTNSTQLLFYTNFLCCSLCYRYLKKLRTTSHKNTKSMK